ncbi:MAG: DUF4174 domain-containing protein [Gammaproteobacteria bacterium]
MSAALLLASPCSAGEGPLSDLESLRWTNRIVLVLASGADAAHAKANLEAAAAGVTERDLLWFVIGEGAIATNFPGALDSDFGRRARQRYFGAASPDDPPGGPGVVLVGKDGGVKSRSRDLDLEDLFDQIDRMPMRQRELRERDAGPPD